MLAFKYFGGNESLRAEVQKYGKDIDNQYKVIFGSKNYKKLRKASRVMLEKESFFSNIREYDREFKVATPEDTINSFSIKTSHLKFDQQDKLRLAQSKLETTCGICTSPEGVSKDFSQWLTSPISFYVHEFDHFVFYALQDVSSQLVSNILFPRIYELRTMNILSDEQRNNLEVVYFSLANIEDLEEKATRILDKKIMRSIGIDVHIPWRGKPEETVPIEIYGKYVGKKHIGGDPFYDMEDDEVINGSLHWSTEPRFIGHYPYLKDLLDSLKKVKVKRFGLNEFGKREYRRTMDQGRQTFYF